MLKFEISFSLHFLFLCPFISSTDLHRRLQWRPPTPRSSPKFAPPSPLSARSGDSSSDFHLTFCFSFFSFEKKRVEKLWQLFCSDNEKAGFVNLVARYLRLDSESLVYLSWCWFCVELIGMGGIVRVLCFCVDVPCFNWETCFDPRGWDSDLWSLHLCEAYRDRIVLLVWLKSRFAFAGRHKCLWLLDYYWSQKLFVVIACVWKLLGEVHVPCFF